MNSPYFIIFLISCLPLVTAQQPYIGTLLEDCDNTANNNSTSVLGYTCNGLRRSCQAYLTFRARPPYDSPAGISALLSANASELARLNSVSENAALDAERVVLVPVTCSCSGQLYQANASYTVQSGDTYLVIANDTFQGLSTCQALQAQNGIPARELAIGGRLRVPLRCACPTRAQADAGVNYLLSYVLQFNQFVETVTEAFGVDAGATLAANSLSESDTVYPFTTLLVPLRDPPNATQATAPQPPPTPANPTAPPPDSGGGSSSKAWIYAVVGGGAGLLVLFVAVAVFLRRRRRRRAQPVVPSKMSHSDEKPLKKKEGDGDDSEDFLESISSIAHSLKVYPFQQLREATQDFSPSCWIKGSVYRGTFNGDFAAIKKMSGDVSKEITLLNKINHSNLIRLSGVSFNEGNWYLVYEYASNGALVDWIHGKGEEQGILSWDRRLQIALDVAAGLNYLHRYTSPPHIHKDLNSSNVLLDGEFRAKIANFGLSRAAEGQEGQFALTRHIVGTKGYMAPEYLENGVISPKLDVYSFGVLLLELLTGKQVSEMYEEVDMRLPEILAPVLSEDGQEKISSLMDPLLLGKYPPDLALVLFRMIDGCLKKDPSARPSMDDVFQSLSRVSGEWAVSISEPAAAPR
ncbi:lysM domain receptor-like kinase 4 [Salvia miltiorrhiza]|uniref:lysM domain receptor-like kinase 4 n=1 Tax=Salvia miltiorrhiza TaxID=226208 RepID=UPI0025ACCEC7|nr:lysM domain receptor-like kinase 4 [Salvia miltiorrhiza]